MSYLQTVPPDQATGDLKAMYDEELNADGYVANYSRAFSLRPDVMQGWLALKNAITSGMDARLYELATVAAATTLRSSYCSLVHGQILADLYYSAEQVASMAGNDDSGVANADAAVLRLARKVAEEAEKITQEDIDELRDLGFSDVDIFNVIVAAAARCFFSKVLDATGTLADAELRGMPEQLRSALTVGREIAPEA
jgi:uncharacterized peroxidase-related enzyme